MLKDFYRGCICPGDSQGGPPGGGSDPLFSSVQLLAHFDGTNGATTSTDSSNAGKTLTFNNGATLSNEQAKFGSTSLKIAGTTDGHVAITPVIDTTQSEWTFECWAYLNASPPAFNFMFGSGNSSVTDFSFSVESGNVRTGGNQGPSFVITGAAFTTQVWHHVAVTRASGNVFELFLDGVSQGTGTDAGEFSPTSFTSIIGDQATGGRQWEGYIDEFRFTAARRYTANFTPPTAPFPDSA